MKKILFIIICSIITLQVSARDIVRASKTSYTIAKQRTNLTPIIRINTISKARASKIKIENQTEQTQFTPAFIKAAKLLSEVVSEDFPLTIQIMYGTKSDFDANNGTGDMLAVTTTNFVLNNYDYRNPNTSNPDRDRNSMNKLIPQAIANREYLADTDPETPDMVIKLNPIYDYYTDTLNTNIAEYEYDLTTVILREMVRGCGFISSLRITKPTYDQVLLGYKSGASNGVEYPYLFDTYITNDKGVRFIDLANSSSSIFSFLINNHLYFNNNQNNEIFNDMSFSDNPTDMSLSTLNRTIGNDETELMTNYFYPNNIIRTITPKTKTILEKLGWCDDIVTSLRSQRCNIISDDGSSITNLLPNTSYLFKPEINPYIDYGTIQFFGLQLVKSDGEYYTLAQGTLAGMLQVNYSTLPNYEFQRDPETGYIIGYIFFYSYNAGYSSWLGTDKYYFTGYKKVLLPYIPTPPIIGVTKMNTTSTTTDAIVSYSSEGATSYKINYTTSGDPTQYVINKANKEDVTCLLNSLPTNRKTTIYVTAQNTSGSINSSTVTVGTDPISSMSMIVTKVGTTLKYQFKQGTQYVTDLTIRSVNIYDLSGNLKMSTTAGINTYFSISSLTSGYYILKVDVANYTVFSKTFMK